MKIKIVEEENYMIMKCGKAIVGNILCADYNEFKVMGIADKNVFNFVLMHENGTNNCVKEFRKFLESLEYSVV